MRLRASIVFALLVAALLLVPGAPAGSKATYYVSLGDSLAQGFQPIGGPSSRESPPGYNQGYADQLFKLTRDRYEQLREVKLGCGGETTTTLRFGGLCAYEQGRSSRMRSRSSGRMRGRSRSSRSTSARTTSSAGAGRPRSRRTCRRFSPRSGPLPARLFRSSE